MASPSSPHPHDHADVSVRPARPEDAAELAAVTYAGWTGPYAALLPEGAAASLREDALADEWRAAADAAPTPRHLVLVAVEADRVVGYAVTAPAADPDSAGADDVAEVLDLVVHPDHQRAGHGSRLLAAATDLLRERGVRGLTSWAAASDAPRAAFLRSAGLDADGATRVLDSGPGSRGVEQVRFSASLA